MATSRQLTTGWKPATGQKVAWIGAIYLAAPHNCWSLKLPHALGGFSCLTYDQLRGYETNYMIGTLNKKSFATLSSVCCRLQKDIAALDCHMAYDFGKQP